MPQDDGKLSSLVSLGKILIDSQGDVRIKAGLNHGIFSVSTALSGQIPTMRPEALASEN
jgi:hypothetical protein